MLFKSSHAGLPGLSVGSLGAQSFLIENQGRELLGGDTDWSSCPALANCGIMCDFHFHSWQRVVQPTILTDVATIFINVLELAKGLDDVEALAGPGDNELRALVQAVIENLESLEDVSPILSLVVQALVEHVHDFVELSRAVVGWTGGNGLARRAPHWVYDADGGGRDEGIAGLTC